MDSDGPAKRSELLDCKSQPPFIVWNEDWRGSIVLVREGTIGR
jgi:hypothetical protein